MWPWHHHTLSFSLGMQHKDVGSHQPDMLLCTIGPTLINTAVGGTTQTALQTPSSRSGGSIETWLLAWAPLTMQDLSLDTNLCVCIPVSLFTCLSYLCVSYLSVSHLSLSPLCLFTSLSPVCLLPVCLLPVCPGAGRWAGAAPPGQGGGLKEEDRRGDRNIGTKHKDPGWPTGKPGRAWDGLQGAEEGGDCYRIFC